eukprot:1822330-Amphidinium_carterae.1
MMTPGMASQGTPSQHFSISTPPQAGTPDDQQTFSSLDYTGAFLNADFPEGRSSYRSPCSEHLCVVRYYPTQHLLATPQGVIRLT